MDQNDLLSLVGSLNKHFIGPLLTLLLLVVGVYYTIRLRGIQRYLVVAARMLFARGGEGEASEQAGMTSFQSLSTAIATQVGTGNIVGVAMALFMGGPGALFWLWVSGLIGMSTNFAEAVLGQKYKTQLGGRMVGGPAYYISRGVGSRWLATIFAVFCVIVLGVIVVMIQANAIVEATALVVPGGMDKLYVGVGLMLMVGFILIGGVGRIARFSERIVPIMALLYIGGCLLFLVLNYEGVWSMLGDVCRYAFTTKAGVGGVGGYAVMHAVRYGISRGLSSNEAGLGSTPHAHAIAQVRSPYEQGLAAILGIGVDVLVCTFTGFVILLSGVLDTNPEAVGVTISQLAFDSTFGVWGSWFMAISLFFFAFSTIIGCYFVAIQNLRFLFGQWVIWPYRIVLMLTILLSALVKVVLIWELTDTFSCFMVLTNVVALFWLSGEVMQEYRHMQEQIHGSSPQSSQPKG